MASATTTCQARLLHNFPKISFGDGARVYLEATCLRPADSESKLCERCAFFERPLHGIVTEKPPPHTHTYLSEWYEKKLLACGPLCVRDQMYLMGAHKAAEACQPLPDYCHPKQSAPPSNKAMPSKPQPQSGGMHRSAAQPPPPPSSPVAERHGLAESSVKIRKSATLTPETQVQVVGKTPRARKSTGARKRSPVARLADQSPPMVSLQSDFRLDKQQTDVIRSTLHVFVPAFIEEADEPLDVTEIEYIKLERQNIEGDEYVNPNDTKEKFAYTPEMGLLRL
jgi:hypothetical protein